MGDRPLGVLTIVSLATATDAPSREHAARIVTRPFHFMRHLVEGQAELKDETYAQHVFDYIEKEDSPAPLTFQLDLLKQVGFEHVGLCEFW